MKRFFFLFFLMLGCISPLRADTVLCIHGFMMSYRTMIPLGKSLKCPGFDVLLWNYPSRSRTTRAHAEELVGLLQSIAAEKPGEPIHFVAHSIGSWILRATLNHPCCPAEALCGKAVLLAPPNRGIWLGRRFCSVAPIRWILGDELGAEIVTYTQADVEALGSFPPNMRIMIVAGSLGTHLWFEGRRNDGYLLVDETHLDTPALHYVRPMRHGSLPRDTGTIRLVGEFLVGNL